LDIASFQLFPHTLADVLLKAEDSLKLNGFDCDDEEQLLMRLASLRKPIADQQRAIAGEKGMLSIGRA
jgi:hypothetical protein